MELSFEVISEVGTGEYPDVVHFANTQAQVFNIKEGELYAMPSDKIDNGEWQNTIFQDELEASPDSGMSHFELKVLPGWGIIGGYKTGNFHKMIIYEFAFEMDRFLSNGSIKHSIDNPISSFTLSLENPDLKDPEKPGNVAINEENSLLSPGAKVRFLFGVGDEEPEFEMGTFYVDRSNFALLSETGTADGRNTIGKVLKDQTVDEQNEYWLKPISTIIQELLLNANLENFEFIIEPTGKESWFNFTPDTNFYEAIEKIFEVMPTWKIGELADGTIVIGSENFSSSIGNGLYLFNRDKDIFSRQITRDDQEVYRRICVHTKDFGIVEYRDIENYQSWNLQANKTLYVELMEGTTIADVKSYADEIVNTMTNIGKIESFTGPFRPHLTPGDGAVIVHDGNNDLGVITEVTHQFGKSGYYTNFTVDSGGKIGKGRLSDFISKIVGKAAGKAAITGQNEIDLGEYINLSQYATATATSYWSRRYRPDNVINGIKTGSGDRMWSPWMDDNERILTIDLGQRRRVDKIMLWLGDESWPLNEAFIPDSYQVEYWDGSRWIHLLSYNGPRNFEQVHEFAAIETSRIRFISSLSYHPTSSIDEPFWREVEIWGNM